MRGNFSSPCGDNFLPPCGGGSGWGVRQCYVDPLDDPIGLSKHIVIPEPEDSKTLRFPPRSSAVVMLTSSSMLATIDLDNQPRFQANEVQDVRTDRDLTTKAMTADLVPAESRPEVQFRIRHRGSEIAGSPNTWARFRLAANPRLYPLADRPAFRDLPGSLAEGPFRPPALPAEPVEFVPDRVRRQLRHGQPERWTRQRHHSVAHLVEQLGG